VALLVGEGIMRASLERQVATRGLQDSVRFCGTRGDVSAILRLVDIVVHPSEQEGFSNAVLEAMAAGRPVVATAVGGNPEAIRDAETGILVPPGQSAELAASVSRLLGDPARVNALGRAARMRVQERFSVERMVAEYEALYEQLLTDKGFRRSGSCVRLPGV
jgi:glycosyltransferase involved in cell wall biosynthesis